MAKYNKFKAGSFSVELITGIGVDVSKSKLDICLLFNNSSIKQFSIHNELKPITEFLNSISLYTGRITLEPTNIYHMSFLELALENNLNICLADPLKVSQFRNFLKGKNKTDLIDSLVLAKIANTDHLALVDKSDLSRSKIRQLVNQLRSLAKTKQIITSQVNSFNSIGLGNEYLKSALNEIKKQIKKVQETIQNNLKTSYSKETIQNLVSIPGISKNLTFLLLALLDTKKSQKQVVSYTGLDPVLAQSGKTKIEKAISKRGNRYLRQIIFQIGFGAGVGPYSKLKPYYLKLKENGRHHREATLIVGKKVLRIFLSILKSGKQFELERINLN